MTIISIRLRGLLIVGSVSAGAILHAQSDIDELPVTYQNVEHRLDVPAEPDDLVVRPPSTPSSPGSGEQANDDRVIYWVHGLTGDRTAWQPVASDIADDLKTVPRFVQYADFQQGHDLRIVATGIEPQLEETDNVEGSPEETIYIGHSLGGIMGRELIQLQRDRDFGLDDAKFRGLATVSTPHLGSELAGARDEIPAILESACHALADGPVLDVITDIPSIPKLDWFKIILPVPPYPVLASGPDAINAPEIARDFLDQGCRTTAFNFITQAIIDAALLPTVADQININSPALAALADRSDPYDIDKANIIASEDAPVVWKLLSSVTGNVQRQAAFAANDDEELENRVQELIANRELMAFALDNEADHIDGFHQHYHMNDDGRVDIHDWSALIWPEGNKASEKRAAARVYREGIRWFENLEHLWLVMQGAREEEIIGTVYDCQCYEIEASGDRGRGYSYETTDRDECRTHPYDDCNAIFLRYQTRNIDVATDGAATVPSQRGWFEDDGSLVPQFEVQGSNHIQIRNDANTEIAVKRWLLLNGGDGDAPFFQTDERD